MSPLRRARPLLRELFAESHTLAGGAALAAATAIAGMALLGLSGWFITATAAAGVQASTALAFDVFGPSAGIRLLALARTGSRYAERLVTHDATFAALARIRGRLFRGWARPDAANRLLRQPAKLLFRLSADIDALESLYLRLLVPAVTALCAALLAALVLGLIEPLMGVALGLWLPLTGVGIGWWLSRHARRPAILRARALEKLRAGAIDLVAGQTDLLMAGRLDGHCAALARTDRALAEADLSLMRLETAAGAAWSVVGSLTLAGVLLACAALVHAGAIGAPIAALALLMALAAVEPLAGLRRGAAEAGRMLLAVKRLGARVGDDRAAPAAADDGGGLSLSRVDAAQGGGRTPVVHDITLRIAAGERVALVGPSGAGKSTLLALAAREIAPLAGVVRVGRVCLMTQRTELFQDSVRDNLSLAEPGADDARLWRALEAAGLAAQVRATSAGLDTMLGEGGLGLSGGQARRLALARLLLHPSPLWLLDEATEALDAATAHDVLARLRTHADGRTLLIATHLRREAALADRLVTVRDGRIAGDARRGTAAFDAALAALRAD